MAIHLTVKAGADDAFIAWDSGFIANCRGFALFRRVKRARGSAPSPNAISTATRTGFVEEIVASWVGFANGPNVDVGTREPTTVWPIQKYLWSDFAVNAGDEVAYRIVPMTGAAAALKQEDSLASDWSETVVIGPSKSGKISCYFNRGIVASQWLARLLPKDADPKQDSRLKGAKLREIIGTPDDPIRNFLAGAIREKMLAMLDESIAKKRHVYAALFELNDPELIDRLKSLKKRAHIVLANGAAKKKGEDENQDARAELDGVCDLHDRFSAPRALAHNKFLVLCDDDRAPVAAWTGSTNWTQTGLCTQANNGVLVENKKIADAYFSQWKALVKAGDDSPTDLRAGDSEAHTVKNVTLWFTPLQGLTELEQAGQLIARAQQGVLFIMFNPGPRGSLLNDIIELASPASPHFNPQLYIQGVVNQEPGTAANPVTLFNRGQRIDANADVVLPAAIDAPTKFFQRELLKLPGSFAMVHAKVVVVDPFGDHPILITGSHNLGPKASGVNDENLLIIENEPALAAQYATKIMEVYNQYRWRASQRNTPQEKRWSGLSDNDGWQIGAPGANADYDKRRRRELDFWFGRG